MSEAEKMNKIINIAVFGDYGTRRIPSAVIKELSEHGFTFALHMSSQPDAPRPFVISEFTSGFAAAQGVTEDECINKFNNMVEKYSEEEWRRQINAAIKLLNKRDKR